ncbi:hypothetical protein Btru_035790 [Bulinus truncatus]|nr:hypothetical protein Btru_035790 [Bulinus truncatus]
MDEQLQLVHRVQRKLHSTIYQLDIEKDPLQIQQLRLIVTEHQTQSQKLLLGLKVMNKIHTELIYARAELKEAIHHGHDKVNLSRKRVIWLEDKMAELCGKEKIKGLEAITYHSLVSGEEVHRRGSRDNNLNELEGTNLIQKNEVELQSKPEFKDDVIENSQDEGENKDYFDVKTTSSIDIKNLESNSPLEGRRHNVNEDTDLEENLYEGEKKNLDTQSSKSEKVYLTEIDEPNEEILEEYKSEYSTVKDPNYKIPVIDENHQKDSEQHQDLASAYWQSEHHRFEYSPFAQQFLEADPLSYHQVGLAVPGSFIQKEDIDYVFKELPWRSRRKESEIKDVHRVALDKLAARIHGLYYKVYDAAQWSVRSWNKHDTDVEKTKNLSPEEPGGKRIPLLSEVKSSSIGTDGYKRHQDAYSKLLPPPSILPITRTSWNKEYPRFANSFCDPDPESRDPAERIVDQRNLKEETKLVLYRDKIKQSIPGASKLEKKFQKMIEHEEGSYNKKSGKKLRASLKATVAITKLKSGTTNWNKIKPESRGKEYSGLRWERVKTIVHVFLQSLRVEERIDGAKQLGVLRCGDTMVTYALKERIKHDPEERVQYEAAKALILIGCWDEEVLECIIRYLALGNIEMRTDLIQTITEGKNVQFVNKTLPSVIELAKILSHFCQNPDPADKIAFHAAVCLGQLCIKDQKAQERLLQTLEDSQDSHIKAKALEILVKQIHFTDDRVVQHIEDLLRDSPIWIYRALACNLLISLGSKHACVIKHNEKIYQLLERHLWDDPSMEVRLTAAKSLTALGMFSRACDCVVLKLEDLEEEKRAQAAIAVGTLGLKNEKVVRLLLEMLELDLSDYVRLMIIRTFRVLKLTDRRVMRSLREREKLDGALGRECRKALKILDQPLDLQT